MANYLNDAIACAAAATRLRPLTDAQLDALERITTGHIARWAILSERRRREAFAVIPANKEQAA